MMNSEALETEWFEAIHSWNGPRIDALISSHPHLMSSQRSTATLFDPELQGEAMQLLGDNTRNMTAVQVALTVLDTNHLEEPSSSIDKIMQERRKRIHKLIQSSSLSDLRLRWGEENTTLHLASFLGEIDVIAALLDRGAPFQLANQLGLAPLDVAADDQTRDLFRNHVSKQIKVGTKRLAERIGPISESSSSIEDSPLPARQKLSKSPDAGNLMPVLASDIGDASTTPASPEGSKASASELAAAGDVAKSASVTCTPLRTGRSTVFTGKYTRPQENLDDGVPQINLRRTRPMSSASDRSDATSTSAGTQRRRITGVNLSLFDDATNDDVARKQPKVAPKSPIGPQDSGTSEISRKPSISAAPSAAHIAKVSASNTSSDQARSATVVQCTDTVSMPTSPVDLQKVQGSSLVSKNPFKAMEKREEATSKVPNRSPGQPSVRAAKQAAVAAPAAAREPSSDVNVAATRTFGHSRVDQIPVDFGKVRATFAKMTLENPEPPRVPVKILDFNPNTQYQQAHSSSPSKTDSTRERAADVFKEELKKEPGLTDSGVVFKPTEALDDSKENLVGASLEEQPVVASNASEDEFALPKTDSKVEVVDVKAENQSAGHDRAHTSSSAMDLADHDQDTSSSPPSNNNMTTSFSDLLPSLPQLSLDLNFDDLGSSFMMQDILSPPTEAEPASRPQESPSKRPAPIKTPAQNSPARPIHHSLPAAPAVSSSPRARDDKKEDRPFESLVHHTTTTEEFSKSSRANERASSELDLAEIQTERVFGGVPIPRIKRQASSPKSSEAPSSTVPPLNASESNLAPINVVSTGESSRKGHTRSRSESASRTSPSRAQSPKNKKQVSFHPACSTENLEGLLYFKVTQVSGLEWVLSGRQMSQAFVRATTLTYMKKSICAWNLFDRRVDTNGITSHATAMDSLQLQVMLRVETRSQPKTGFLSALKMGRKEEPTKDVKEECIGAVELCLSEMLGRARGHVFSSCTQVDDEQQAHPPVSAQYSCLFLPSVPAQQTWRSMSEAAAGLEHLNELCSKVSQEGYISQQGDGVKFWKQRYYKLVGWHLIPHADDGEPKDPIELAHCTEVVRGTALADEEIASIPHSFMLIMRAGERIKFTAESDVIADKWAGELRKMIDAWPGESLVSIAQSVNSG